MKEMREDAYVIIYYDDSSEQATLAEIYYNEKSAEIVYEKMLKEWRGWTPGSFSDDEYLQLAAIPVSRIDEDGLERLVGDVMNTDFYNYINQYGVFLLLDTLRLERINDKED